MVDVLQGLADRILELEVVGTDLVILKTRHLPGASVSKDNKESLMVSKDGSKTGRFFPVSETETDEIIKREKNKNNLSKTK